jgi:hypothetical protein
LVVFGLERFLTTEDHIFTRAHISNDVERLNKDCGISIRNPKDLQAIVPEAIQDTTISSVPVSTGGHHWRILEDAPFLKEDQVKYCAIDVFLSYEIANQLVIKHGYKFM